MSAAKSTRALAKLRRDAAAYHEKWRAGGGLLTAYKCPSCGEKEPTPRPKSKATVGSKGYWDSVMRCTGCGGLSFVKVWPSGRTQAVAFDGEVKQ